jgi:preprotein translocase subunit SecD
MKRLLFIVGTFSVALSGCGEEKQSQLQVYIAEKDARPGLHQANYPTFPNLGYIPDKPDLIISKLEGVSFAPLQIPGVKPGESKAEDRMTLVIQLTKTDADSLNELTKKHISDRLLILLNDEPLIAPEIRTPSTGQSIYIHAARGMNASEIKSKLESLVRAK